MHDRETSLEELLESASAAPLDAGQRRAVPGSAEKDRYGFNLIDLAAILLKRWKIAFGMPLIVAFVAAAYSLLIPFRYTAYVVFVAEVNSPRMNLPGGLAGLAGLIRLQVPDRNSPRFYADVIGSRALRDQVLLSTFVDPRERRAAPTAILLDILEIQGVTEAERLEIGRRILRAITRVRYNNVTSVVNVAITTTHPQLSADIANRYIEVLNRFNVETRQSNARTRRLFIEERLEQADRELVEAEGKLKVFLETNKEYQGSPELVLQQQRLRRQVNLAQEVFTTLRRSYEEARIEEVNDTPIITVIDEALPPERRSGPKRKLIVVVTFLFFGAVGALVALLSEYVAQVREADPARLERLKARWAEVGGQLRSPFRRLVSRGS